MLKLKPILRMYRQKHAENRNKIDRECPGVAQIEKIKHRPPSSYERPIQKSQQAHRILHKRFYHHHLDQHK